MYVIVSPLRAYGPFATPEDATRWALTELGALAHEFQLKELREPISFHEKRVFDVL